MKISIVIPALNEEKNIGELVRFLRDDDRKGFLQEIIVVDGGSTDDTRKEAEGEGARVIFCERARRSTQMNCGAASATGEVLYFLHADCRPPSGYLERIVEALEEGHIAGCFRRAMHEKKRYLKWITASSHLGGTMFRGGDSSLYITRSLFQEIGGFDDDMILMEDYEILKRLRRHTRFHVIPEYVHASDRKHEDNPSTRVLVANVLVYTMYLTGFSQERMLSTYRRMVSGTRYQR